MGIQNLCGHLMRLLSSFAILSIYYHFVHLAIIFLSCCHGPSSHSSECVNFRPCACLDEKERSWSEDSYSALYNIPELNTLLIRLDEFI